MKTYRLNGPIITDYDWKLCELDESILKNYITASDVHNMLANANGEDVSFNVNSGGGSVFEANEIYTMLQAYEGRVIVNITGLAASAASYMILGADEVNISKSAQIMIHKPTSWTDGDSVDHKRTINLLDATESSIAGLYAEKTGIDKDKIVEMMFNETWLTADEAKKIGFVDNIINDNTIVDVKNIVAIYNQDMNKLNEFKTLVSNLQTISKGENMGIFDELKKVMNISTEEDKQSSEATEEPVAYETELAEENNSETETHELEGNNEHSEEVVEETEEDTTELMEKAVDRILELEKENQSLKEENKSLKETENKLYDENSKLKSKDANARNVVKRLNEALEKGKITIVDNTSRKEPKFDRFGYPIED